MPSAATACAGRRRGRGRAPPGGRGFRAAWSSRRAGAAARRRRRGRAPGWRRGSFRAVSWILRWDEGDGAGPEPQDAAQGGEVDAIFFFKQKTAYEIDM